MRIPQLLLRFVRFERQIGPMLRPELDEDAIVEVAPWFGTTGLASDLAYLGTEQRGRARIHYWEVPSSTGKSSYAYVKVKASGNVELGTSTKRSIA
jgi:hypothetical protein